MSDDQDNDLQQDGPLLDENGNPIEEADGQQEEAGNRHAGLIAWIASGAMHATAILLLGVVVFGMQEEEAESPPTRVSSIPPPPEKKEEKPKMEREILDPKVSLDIDKESDQVAPLTQMEPTDNSSREEDNDNPVPKGREEAVADSEMGGQGAFMAIGAGGGSAGMFGSRSGGGRKRAVGRGGGSKGSESAVEAALRWFKKHQSPNGRWDSTNYFQNCTENPKCEPGTGDVEQVDTAMTGYALLAFLGAGYDHKTPNKYRATVKKGIDYLVSIQKPDGLLGVRNYEHPIASMALAEAYAMTSDPDLRAPSQKCVDVILKRQNQSAGGDAAYAGLGWDYVGPNTRNDASVTGWNVMALKSAYAAGLNVGNGMEGSKRWLEAAWKANNDGKGGRPDWQKLDVYKDESLFSYCYTSGATEFEKGFGHQNMAPVGMVCAVFLGHKAGDPMLETLANFVMNRQTPKAFPCNTYYMYYNTLGMFQVGGDKWKLWNGSVRDMLVAAQRKGDGCFDGSWDPAGTGPAAPYGRVLNTAYCALCLEVYYRYAQVQKIGGGAGKPAAH